MDRLTWGIAFVVASFVSLTLAAAAPRYVPNLPKWISTGFTFSGRKRELLWRLQAAFAAGAVLFLVAGILYLVNPR